jgi:hypothetical protein
MVFREQKTLNFTGINEDIWIEAIINGETKERYEISEEHEYDQSNNKTGLSNDFLPIKRTWYEVWYYEVYNIDRIIVGKFESLSDAVIAANKDYQERFGK